MGTTIGTPRQPNFWRIGGRCYTLAVYFLLKPRLVPPGGTPLRSGGLTYWGRFWGPKKFSALCREKTKKPRLRWGTTSPLGYPPGGPPTLPPGVQNKKKSLLCSPTHGIGLGAPFSPQMLLIYVRRGKKLKNQRPHVVPQG